MAENADLPGDTLLLQYSGSQITPIVASGRNAPGGQWPRQVFVAGPVSMNQRGTLVFATQVQRGSETPTGVFAWDPGARQVVPLVLAGSPAVPDLTFVPRGGDSCPINNLGEVAFTGHVVSPSGAAGWGLFMRSRDGQLLPILQPDQGLGDLGPHQGPSYPSLNDAGRLVFSVWHDQGRRSTLYVWEQGKLTPLVEGGTEAPGGGEFRSAIGWVNNKNDAMLVQGVVDDLQGGREALYLLDGNRFTALLLPGDGVPGGRYRNVPFRGISAANDAGQHAVLLNLEDSATGAYLIDAEGSLSPILKSGDSTSLGKVTHVGGPDPSYGIGLNNKGQIALNIQFDEGPLTLVLLTPVQQ